MLQQASCTGSGNEAHGSEFGVGLQGRCVYSQVDEASQENEYVRTSRLSISSSGKKPKQGSSAHNPHVTCSGYDRPKPTHFSICICVFLPYARPAASRGAVTETESTKKKEKCDA